MRRALALARRGGRAVFPNPKVGCVLVKDRRAIAEGWHKKFGGPHAEAAALKKAGRAARGATAYVNLEPCCAHPGKKTPPCAPALVKAGVSRVVAAMKDPNPAVAGNGLALLERAGVSTRVGLCAREAVAANADFFRRMQAPRPYVILKTALSLDGLARTASGKSKWITSPAARRAGRKLRSECDAILVGVGTVLADDPSLTALGGRRNPLRAVLDARGRTPRGANVLDGAAPTIIFTASGTTFSGAETVRVPARSGRLDLTAVLRVLSRRGVKRLLVEGGPTVHAAFLAAGLVDEARVFLSPKLLAGAADPNRAPRLSAPRVRKIGPDFLFYGRVH